MDISKGRGKEVEEKVYMDLNITVQEINHIFHTKTYILSYIIRAWTFVYHSMKADKSPRQKQNQRNENEATFWKCKKQ